MFFIKKILQRETYARLPKLAMLEQKYLISNLACLKIMSAIIFFKDKDKLRFFILSIKKNISID